MSLVLVTGAGGGAGRELCAQLVARGHTVAAVDLTALAIDGAEGYAADLSTSSGVEALREVVVARQGRPDAAIHLVGGWRGGKTLAENTDADWEFLRVALVETLRHVSMVFHDDLVASSAGRLMIVSALTAAKPDAGNANYAAAKAAAEAWMTAVADSFAKSGSDAAAVTFVVKALLTDAMREAQPERKFPGFTHVHDLASAVVDLVEGPAENGAKVNLAG